MTAPRAGATGKAACPEAIEDDRLIRELLQNWAIWRDAGDWERFAPYGIPTAA